MKPLRCVVTLCLLGGLAPLAQAQSDVSLFWRSDSVQVSEIVVADGDQYRKVGHHGPAVENAYMALRLYFNHSGSIDVYTKKKPGLELATAHWYPTEKMQTEQGYGCDEYKVGKTVGLGGYNLWDGEKVLPLTATEGREARVYKIEGGAVAEMLAKGVPYKNKKVNLLMRVTVRDDSREATVEARVVKGPKLSLVTGVNFHPGRELFVDESHIAAWGRHPEDVAKDPIMIGGGMVYRKRSLLQKSVTDQAVVLITKPTKRYATRVVSAGEWEAELNTADRFIEYVKSLEWK